MESRGPARPDEPFAPAASFHRGASVIISDGDTCFSANGNI